jgi:hypothetical protein
LVPGLAARRRGAVCLQTAAITTMVSDEHDPLSFLAGHRPSRCGDCAWPGSRPTKREALWLRYCRRCLRAAGSDPKALACRFREGSNGN